MRIDRHFLDTNVIAYAFDETEPRKQKIAQHLLEAHSGHFVVSTQVLIELYSVCVTKLGLTPAASSSIVATAAGLDVVPTDRNLILDAVALSGEEQLSVFDAAIVCAARRAECDQILTEDAEIAAATGSISVVDPFAV